MRRLDAEAAHVLRGEVERDVVLLRAQHRLAGVGHLDGERLGGGRRRAATPRQQQRNADCRETPRELPSPSAGRGGEGGIAERSTSAAPPTPNPSPPRGRGIRSVQAVSLAEHSRRPRSWPRAAGRRCGRPCRPWRSSGRRSAPGSRPAPRRSRSARARLADRGSASATSRWIVVNSKESAGSGRRQAGQHGVLEALHVDLGEGRRAVLGDQRVERCAGHLDARVPHLALPAAGAVGRAR